MQGGSSTIQDVTHWLLAMFVGLGLGADERKPDQCRIAERAALHSLDEELPELRGDARWGRLFAGAYSTDSQSWAQDGDVVVRFTLVGERSPPSITLPLMLPRPMSGTVTVQPLAEGPRWCAGANAALRGGALASVELGLPAMLSARFQRGANLLGEMRVRASALHLTRHSIEDPRSKATFYVGDLSALGDDFDPEHPAFRKFLDAAGARPEDVLRLAPGRDWDRVLLALILADLERWRPGENPAVERLILDLDPARFAGEQRRALGYWKATFAPPTAGAPALGRATLVPRMNHFQTIAVPGRILAKGAPGRPLTPVRVEIPPGRLLRLQVTSQMRTQSGILIELSDAWLALAPGTAYDLYTDSVEVAGRDPHRPRGECVSVTFEGTPDAEWDLEGAEVRYRSGQVVAPPPDRWRQRISFLSEPKLPPREIQFDPTHDGTYSFTVKRSGEIMGAFDPDRTPCHP